MCCTETWAAKLEGRRLILDTVRPQGDRRSREAFSARERRAKIEVFLASEVPH